MRRLIALVADFVRGVSGRADASPVTAPTERGLRRILIVILCLGHVGLGAELLLLGHTERPAQWIPVVLLGVGLGLVAAQLFRPGRRVLAALLIVMGLDLAAGTLGVALHYRGNVEFALEMSPALSGLALFGKAMAGATPALAPGAMIQLGLVGLAYGYRHPLRSAGGHSSEVRK